jgi:hypothetical protein
MGETCSAHQEPRPYSAAHIVYDPLADVDPPTDIAIAAGHITLSASPLGLWPGRWPKRWTLLAAERMGLVVSVVGIE